MKPLLYHLEYHIENGYFEKLPKGQAIKMVIGNDGGIQTIYGRGTGSGKVLFSSGKSVLFAIDRSKEELKVVFRAYSDDKFLGEAVQIFKGTSFPKRTDVGEPASYTFGSDLGFRKGLDLVGAIKSFIRMTSFGESIISDCIKDGNYYRVRMTSLIVERNKDPKKNVKPWWVILDGRRLRFSRWLRALEKEGCTKEVCLNVKKCPDEDDTTGVCETFLQEEEEDEAALETVEAALKKDFEFIREFGSQETYDKGSQANFIGDPSSALRINSFGIKLSEINCFDQKKISASCNQINSSNPEEDTGVKNISDRTVLSSEVRSVLSSEVRSVLSPEVRSSSCEIKGSGFIVSKHDEGTQNKHYTDESAYSDDNKEISSNICDKNVPESIENNVLNNKILKADDIFHFERSTSDVLEKNRSPGSSGATSLISEEICARHCEVEPPIVTGRSFLAETIVGEIIDIIIERIFEREYCSVQDHAIDLMSIAEEESGKVVRVVGYGDTESLMDLSVLGIANASPRVDLSIPEAHGMKWNSLATSPDENEKEKEERNIPKTVIMCRKKIPLGIIRSSEECSLKNCKERENDVQHESCTLLKSTEQRIFEDRLDSRSLDRNECKDHRSSHLNLKNKYDMNPIRNSVDHGISEWLINDMITQCFVYDEETRSDTINSEGLKSTIIATKTSLVEPKESSTLPRPEDACRPDFICSSDESQPMQIITSNTYHPYLAESESNCNYTDKTSSENSRGLYQVKNNQSQDTQSMEEFLVNAITTQVTAIEQDKDSRSNDDMKK